MEGVSLVGDVDVLAPFLNHARHHLRWFEPDSAQYFG